MTRPATQKNLLTILVKTHLDGIEDPPPDETGSRERRGGQTLLAIVGSRLAVELPGVDHKLMPLAVELHGWDGRQLDGDGFASPLGLGDAVYLVVGACSILAARLPSDDARAQLCAAFASAFDDLVAEISGADVPRRPEPGDVH